MFTLNSNLGNNVSRENLHYATTLQAKATKASLAGEGPGYMYILYV